MKHEMIAGTAPDVDEQHELRTLVRNDGDNQMLYMMTEIADGTFVAWETCARCNQRVKTCGCPSGPVEPDYIQRWRTERMDGQWGDRGVEPPLPATITERDRTKRAVMRQLLAEGYAIIAPGEPVTEKDLTDETIDPVPPQVEILRTAEAVQSEEVTHD